MSARNQVIRRQKDGGGDVKKQAPLAFEASGIRCRICVLLATGILLAAALPAANKPNVVFLLSDNHSYYELSIHGHPYVRTPNLDRLAREGIEFTNWYADAFCSPSRSSLLTGRNSMSLGIYHTIGGRYLLPPEAVTMADIFKRNGYRTGIFGKWHLGFNSPFRPADRGFEVEFIPGGGSVGDITSYYFSTKLRPVLLENGAYRKFDRYITDVLFDKAIEFIRDNADRPFFCYVPTTVTHRPWSAPEAYAKRFQGHGEYAQLYGEIENLDDNVGRLLNELKRLGLERKTIVFFMSDQGMQHHSERSIPQMRREDVTPQELPQSGRHRHLVPAFMRYPVRIAPGKRTNRLVWNCDLLPTLVELCELRTPRRLPLDGRSLVPLLDGDLEDWPERIIVFQCPRARTGTRYRHSAVVTQRWSLLEGKYLYDDQDDPAERKDVSGEHPRVAARLKAEYERHWQGDFQEGDVPCAATIIGADNTRETLLNAMSWYRGDLVWTRAALRQHHSGVWLVDVARAGRYRVELRRFPREVDKPIGAVSATLEIGDRRWTKRISTEDAAVVFDVQLEKGTMDLGTTFAGRGTTFGAYFAYIRLAAKDRSF